MPRSGESSHAGGSIWCTWPVNTHSRMSAITMDSPIVTIVCRRSSPGMRRKIASCIARPTSADAAKPAAAASSHQPVFSATTKPT